MKISKSFQVNEQIKDRPARLIILKLFSCSARVLNTERWTHSGEFVQSLTIGFSKSAFSHCDSAASTGLL